MKEETDIRWKQRFRNYEKALKQLCNAVELYNSRKLTELEVQGLIKSFEFTIELAWKVLKDYLEYNGFSDIYGSKIAVRQAFQSGIIDNGQEWIDMIEDRNLSSHTYDENIAAQLAKNIAENFFIEFQNLHTTLKKLAENE